MFAPFLRKTIRTLILSGELLNVTKGAFWINVDFEIYNEIIRLSRMKISKVVKFKYIYVFIWNKIDILVSSKKKMEKKWCGIHRGASSITVINIICLHSF